MSVAGKLVYVHDPMCSWCWGFNETYEQLIEALPNSIEVIRLLGGLAPDSSEPMPPEMQRYLQQTWKEIENSIPGVQFNHDFWVHCHPRRSTWPACRAVIAARLQGAQFDLAMTHAIQRAYYQNAKNPSDDAVLIELAVALGLDSAVFTAQLNSESTRQQLEQEIMFSRQLSVRGFPSLVSLAGNSSRAIQINFTDFEVMLEDIISQ